MAKTYEQTTSNTLRALGTYIKGKIPVVDTTVTEESTHAVSSAAVYKHVEDAIKEIGGIEFKKVDVLPETGDSKYIYLVPKAETGEQNVYDEYIWYNNTWELIGSTAIDLSGYVKAEEMHEITAEEVNTILNAVWGD